MVHNQCIESEAWEASAKRGTLVKYKVTLKDSVNSGKITLLLNDVILLYKAKM